MTEGRSGGAQLKITNRMEGLDYPVDYPVDWTARHLIHLNPRVALSDQS